MDSTVYVRGAFRSVEDARVSVFDHGLLYGDGVFEGIRAYDGRVFKLERHVARLFDSAKAIRLGLPVTREDLAELVLETCRRNDIVDGYIRLVVTRGAGDLGIDPQSCPTPEIIIIARRVGALYQRTPSNQITVVTSAFRRPAPDTLSPAIKTLNYMNNIMARIEATDRGADEALFLDQNGYVAEATVDNIFIVCDQSLVVPPVATNLRGITRETVLELAGDLGIAVAERPFSLFDVWTASEVFICGTMAEIVPVGSVDGRVIGDGTTGVYTARILSAYHAFVRSTGTPIRHAVAAR